MRQMLTDCWWIALHWLLTKQWLPLSARILFAFLWPAFVTRPLPFQFVKCSLSQLPITVQWTQTRSAASTRFSPRRQREMKKKEWMGSTWGQGWNQSFIWILDSYHTKSLLVLPDRKSSTFWEICLFSFLSWVKWKDWCSSHIFTINMKQPIAAGSFSLAQR